MKLADLSKKREDRKSTRPARHSCHYKSARQADNQKPMLLKEQFSHERAETLPHANALSYAQSTFIHCASHSRQSKKTEIYITTHSSLVKDGPGRNRDNSPSPAAREAMPPRMRPFFKNGSHENDASSVSTFRRRPE